MTDMWLTEHRANDSRLNEMTLWGELSSVCVEVAHQLDLPTRSKRIFAPLCPPFSRINIAHNIQN